MELFTKKSVDSNHWLVRCYSTHCQMLSFVTTGAGCEIYSNYNYTINDILLYLNTAEEVTNGSFQRRHTRLQETPISKIT